MRSSWQRLAGALALLLFIACVPAEGQLWWERGADKWYYKDDWKGQALSPAAGGNRPGAVLKTVAVPGGAASGWIVIWGDSGYSLVVDGKPVGASVDGGLIDDYDLSPFMSDGAAVLLRIEGAKVCAEGEIVGRDGKRYPFATGEDWQTESGRKPVVAKMAVQASSDAYNRSHNGRLMTYNEEERGKTAIAKAMARIQKLNDQGIYLMRRFRPAEEIVSFDPETPWRRAERVAMPLVEQARAIIISKAVVAQKAERFADAVAAADEAANLIAAAEVPVEAATELYRADRERVHLANWFSLLGDKSVNLAEDFAELDRLSVAARRAHALGDWGSAAKVVDRMNARSGEVRARLMALAGRSARPIIGGVGALDEFPEDRFGWFNARDLMGNSPENWPFVAAPATASYIDLTGHWDFRIDADNVGEQQGWASAATEGWQKLFVPLAWEYQGITQENLRGSRALFASDTTGADKPYNGFAWYRKDVFIPAAWQGRKLTIIPGDVYNWGRIFVNGKPAHDGYKRPGRIGPFKRFRIDPPQIEIPAELVKFGQINTIAIQVYNHDRFGGIAIGPVAIYAEGGAAQSVETAGPLSFAYESAYPTTDGIRQYTLLASALSPAVVVASDGSSLDLWGWEAKGHALPDALESSTGDGQHRLGAEEQSFAPGDTGGQWFRISGGDTNALIVPAVPVRSMTWHKGPAGVMVLTISFEKAPAMAAVVCLPADARIDADACRSLAQSIRDYPVSATELTRSSDRPGIQTQSIRYNYLRLDPNARPASAGAAPLPMLASYALQYNHPGVSAANAEETAYRSRYTSYRLARGADTITYEAPAVDRSKMMKGVGELFGRKRAAENVHGGVGERAMFQRMAEWGFDHCRYAFAFNAEWDLQLVRSMGGAVLDNEENWKRLDEVVKNCNDAGMQMMLCSFTEIRSRNWLARPEQEKNVFEMWRRIAQRCADLPEWAVSYDFFNEPAYMNGDHWNRIMKDLTAVIRSVDKKHTIVWEAADGWAQPFWCMWMEPVKDDNVIYSFHHYGKHWGYAYDEYYPGYKSTFEWTQADPYLEALLWSIKHNVTIHCGEFGISMIQPDGDGEAWLNDHLAMFERFGIGWNWWNYSGSDIYRTGLAAGERISPYVPIMSKWAARSGFGAERRAAGLMPPIVPAVGVEAP